MTGLELPLKQRTRLYRFFEIVPGALSYGLLIVMIILSLIDPLLASIYLLLLIVTMIIKAVGIAAHSVAGHNRMKRAKQIDWADRLLQLEDPMASYVRVKDVVSGGFDYRVHKDNLRLIVADPDAFPRPSQLFNAVFVAAYNESYSVIKPTIQTIADTTYANSQIILVLAYEERGGEQIAKTIKRLADEYKDTFYACVVIAHPSGLPDEIVGKGSNITYAARQFEDWLEAKRIDRSDIIVTTLDCDNKPYSTYFDYLTYEYIVNEDRKHLSFQPVALYFGNIWDAPAPMRIIATGNSFWTIVSSVRPHTLRNFAAHSQPMEALAEMGYWSKRSIVEDGHQYWRSYFYFRGQYGVIPIHVPIYQDAVLGETFKSTLIAQFKQLRRWGYGASDVPYVATRLFTRDRTAPFFPTLARFIRLIDSHVTLATVAILVAVGAWIPLLVNPEAAHNITAHNLPQTVSYLQRGAMVGLFVTIILSLRMLPPRPSRHRKSRNFWMVAQWVLMPLTAILYNSAASLNAQTHLMFGKYLDKFEVTEKVTREQLPDSDEPVKK